MEKVFHTVVTSERHREYGYCEKSDFGTIELFILQPHEKELIVSFTDYDHKEEFINFRGYAYRKFNKNSYFFGMSKDEQAEWGKKQGYFSKETAINLMLEFRKRMESQFSYVATGKYILIGKTLYARYSKLKDLVITSVGNTTFAHWISIDIEARPDLWHYKLSKKNFDKLVKEEYARWKKGDPKTTNIVGQTHSCFSKPTKVKWGKKYLI